MEVLHGANLAAARVVCLLGGAVRFIDNPDWFYSRSKVGRVRFPSLPKGFSPSWQVEAIGICCIPHFPSLLFVTVVFSMTY